mgnify:FL=1
MREGFRCGMILEIVYGAAVMVICQVFAGELMALFVKDEEVIGHGVIYLHLIAVMYIFRPLRMQFKDSSVESET